MFRYAKPLRKLIEELMKLPGIGPKTAERLSFYILACDQQEVMDLAGAISDAKKKIFNCSVCGNLSDIDPCMYCRDSRRDQTTICVVETPKDVAAIEKTRSYQGLYHVLHGAISPVDGIGPDKLKIDELVKRVKEKDIKEVILASSPNVEGEATSLYITKLLQSNGCKITRLAYGLPVGGDLDYADELTLAKAFEGRQELRYDTK